MRVLLSGATGFIGREVLNKLVVSGHNVSTISRNAFPRVDVRQFVHDNVGDPAFLSSAISGQDCIIHCLGYASNNANSNQNETIVHEKVNRDLTRLMAEKAKDAGVKKFVYLSSTKVFGNYCHNNLPFKVHNVPCPQSAYARTKWQAEQALVAVGQSCNMATVIIRSPLVYGPNVKGNMRNLIRLVKTGIPLPLGDINNALSFINILNLSDALEHCIQNIHAKSLLVSVCDGSPISTTELLALLYEGYRIKNRLFKFSEQKLELLSSLTGMWNSALPLLRSSHVDYTESQTLMKWRPICTTGDGILAMANTEI